LLATKPAAMSEGAIARLSSQFGLTLPRGTRYRPRKADIRQTRHPEVPTADVALWGRIA
jgi:hypothetical protein